MTSIRTIFPFAAAAWGALALLGCSGGAGGGAPEHGGTGSGPATQGSGTGSSGTGTGPGVTTPVMTSATRNLQPSTTPTDEATLVKGNTDFAFSLYHQLSQTSTTDNLFYSPYSVSLALAMTYAGARGETATEMATALDFTLPDAALNPAFDKLDLAIEATPTHAAGANGTPFAIRLADSLWGAKSIKFSPAFVSTLASDYGAGLRTVDFADDPVAAEAAINGWVSTETDGDINPLLSPGAITDRTALVLVNAVFFNAAWASPFDKNSTHAGTFTRADGTTVSTPMMSVQEIPARLATGANYQAIELPYSGGTTSMVVIVPNAGAYAAVEAGLGSAMFESITGSLRNVSTGITMPSFKIHGATVSLKPHLESMGMVEAFDDKADFTGMIPQGGVSISDVLHQAFVDVDESGTQAAAATAVVVVLDSTVEMSVQVDRAFFFFIRDVATNTVLFVGRESDPTKE